MVSYKTLLPHLTYGMHCRSPDTVKSAVNISVTNRMYGATSPPHGHVENEQLRISYLIYDSPHHPSKQTEYRHLSLFGVHGNNLPLGHS